MAGFTISRFSTTRSGLASVVFHSTFPQTLKPVTFPKADDGIYFF
jgi:hypothetical protein